MQLRKYHALGNDFLILVDPDGKQPIDSAVARAVCDRHRGVGADGLIRVTAPGPCGLAAVPHMQLYNADGSAAETSGNGLRCVARALVDAGLAAGPNFTITTDAGPRVVTLLADGQVSVTMGEAKILPEMGPSSLVELGNPHAVTEVDDPAAVDLAAAAGFFPGRNVEVVAAGPGEDELTMRVWERGVGETQACGSGACAAVAAAHDWGRVGTRVTVHQPGGDVVVELGPPIVLTGPTEFVCEVEYPWP